MSAANNVPGHVFVIHGGLQDVTCDAALIPTDTAFAVEEQWWTVVGTETHPERPAQWADLGFAQDATNDRFWFVDVTDDNAVSAGASLVARLSAAMAQIAARLRGVQVVRGRARHLIAMPLLGAGGGGLGSDAAVRILLDGLQEIADDSGVDLAIVVLRRDRFEALQRKRQALNHGPDAQHWATAQELGKLVRQGALSLMIGAGVSMGAGLPDWAGLLNELAADVPDRSIVTSTMFKDLPVLDQAELLARLLKDEFSRRVVAAVRGDEPAARLPALGHFLLAGLGCSQVATTNYDLLYEAAVRSQADATHLYALPYERPEPASPWILKMHGDAEHEEDLVLSRSSFVAYDARRRAAGSVFQTMLMTSHVLFVGVSLTDDNVLRLTHEVTGLVRNQQLGTALGLGANPAKAELWKGTLRWIDVKSPHGLSWAEKFDELAWQVRELEIFLDSVALWSVPERKALAVDVLKAH
ncbi:SIR2 family protein [Flexivirga lutea]